MRIRVIIALVFLCGPTFANTVHIVDGDTLDVDGTRYRINGIDAPEAGQKCKTERGKDWACGTAATNALFAITKGKTVRCDSLAVDSYGRDIGRCYAGKTDIAKAMVTQGMAWAFLKFSDEYEGTQNIAKSAKRGIWRGKAQPAWVFRATKWEIASQKSPNGCPIKGNISPNGKIYHPPWSPWYNRTRINTSKGERWFCDEDEALKAGWRAPRWK